MEQTTESVTQEIYTKDSHEDIPFGDAAAVEKILNTQFKCYVRDLGRKEHKDGHWTIGIIVGKRPNPQYKPNSPLPGTRAASERLGRLIPDVRVVHVPGNASVGWLITRIQNIKNTLPEYKQLPPRDTGVTAINPNASANFAKLPPSELPTVQEVDLALGGASQIPVQSDQKPDRMEDIYGLLTGIADRIETIEGRLVKVETLKSGSVLTGAAKAASEAKKARVAVAAEEPKSVIQA